MHFYKNRKAAIITAVIGVVAVALAGWEFYLNSRCVTATGFAMGAAVVQRLSGRDGAAVSKRILESIRHAENKELSWRAEGSDVARINSSAGGSVEVSTETAELLRKLSAFYEKSSGAFDPTVGHLTRLWDFDSGKARLPEKNALDAALSTVNGQELIVNGSSVTLKNPNAALELGAVGKGYACDKAKTVLENSKVKFGTVSVGGSVLVWSKTGQKTQTVAVRDPLGDTNDALGVLEMADGVVSTSGNYERYFDLDGVRYHHILDPKTGMPAQSGLLSVTVLCDSGLYSDALSTACYILGFEKSLPLLEAYGAEALFVSTDKTVRKTAGVSFTLSNPAYRLVKWDGSL